MNEPIPTLSIAADQVVSDRQDTLRREARDERMARDSRGPAPQRRNGTVRLCATLPDEGADHLDDPRDHDRDLVARRVRLDGEQDQLDGGRGSTYGIIRDHGPGELAVNA